MDQPATACDRARGEGLAFVIGAFRSGTTLLRKILDSHSMVYAPAETWFLLPLLNLWDGQGATPHYNPRQASAAIQGHLDQPGFVSCVRAFAGRFYDQITPAGARWVVDKTPLYLRIAPALASIFPEARFIVLARDPRGICWSRHTWQHADAAAIASRVPGVVEDCRRVAAFASSFLDRSLLVRYEDLCAQPARVAGALCAFLNLADEPAMVEYGRTTHHEGYGDEHTRRFDRPHDRSIDRWQQGMGEDIQRALLDGCGERALEVLGYAPAGAGR